jgi:hypothetical protein
VKHKRLPCQHAFLLDFTLRGQPKLVFFFFFFFEKLNQLDSLTKESIYITMYLISPTVVSSTGISDLNMNKEIKSFMLYSKNQSFKETKF